MRHDQVGEWPLDRTTVELCGRRIELSFIADDRLVEGGCEGRENPFFGKLWPAGVSLAQVVLERGRLDGLCVLDLGCGPGLPGIAAAFQGARVTFADIVPEALELARINAAKNGVTGEFRQLDARDSQALGITFDLVLAADFLYEKWKPEILCAALPWLLADDGTALVTDPDRPDADRFAEMVSEAGFDVRSSTPARSDTPIRLFELRPRRRSC